LLLSVMAAFALTPSGCGGGGRRPPSVDSFHPVGAAVSLDSELVELDALPTPAGVDEGVFSSLKTALAEALRARAHERMAAAPPVGPSNAVDDLTLAEGVGNWVLTWSYKNTGDYNQDGTVNIQDITPLAVHFNEPSGPENEWINGNGDGAINILDVTPLAAAFFRECAGYSLQIGSGPDSGFGEHQWVDFSSAVGEGRLQFEVVLPIIMDKAYLRVVPKDSGGASGPASNVRGIPGMALSVTSLGPRGGLEGAEAQFVAQVDGVEPISYFWDFGGGAIPDTSEEVSPTVVLGPGGIYDASLALANDYCDYTYEFRLTSGTAADAPQINGVAPPGGIEGNSVRFTLDLSGTAPFTYSWDFDGAGTPDTAAVASPEIELAGAGSYDCSVTVSNDFGQDSEEFTVEVGVIGSLPRVTSVSPAKAPVNRGQQFTAAVSGVPPFWYSWDFGDAADPSIYEEASPIVNFVVTGDAECTVTAFNVYGEGSRDFTVDVGYGPEIESVDYDQLLSGQTAAFSVTISAGEGPFSYSWNFGGGATPNTSAEESPTVLMGDPGLYSGSVTMINYYGPGTYPFDYEVLGIPAHVEEVVPTFGGSGQDIMMIPSYRGTPPVTLAWDFGGGADPDTSAEETPTVTLGAGGVYGASLTASNLWGEHTYDFDLSVGVRSTVDSGGVGTGGLSACMVNGRPAVAYYDGIAGDLLYCRAGDEWGNTWGTPVQVDTSSDVGRDASLAVIDGNPAVSYLDAVVGNLKYARASDADGGSWETPVTPDSTGGVAGYTTLLEVAGRPAVSYYGGIGDLKYVRANDSTGATWGTPGIVYGTDDVGKYASMAIVNGFPGIAFYDATDKDLMFVRAADAEGLTWDFPVALATTGDVGGWCSLAVISGLPAVAYRNIGLSRLDFVVAKNSDGTLWNAPVRVVETGAVGGYESLTEIFLCPAIGFQDLTANDLGYVRASNTMGTTWSGVVNPDTDGDTGGFTDGLVMPDGRPALVTVEMGAGDIRFILANDLIGTEWPMP